MKVVLTESQYKILLSEQFKKDVDSILKSSYEFTKDIVKTAEQQLKTSFQFLLTYGAGIGSLARPLSEYLQGKYSYLTQEEIAGLVVMAISIAYFQMKGEMKKPMEMLKLQGKLEELKDAIEKTKSIENRFVKILNQLGVYVYSVLDIPAYTFLLPVIPFIISFISDPSSSGDKLEMAVNGLLNSSLITLSAATLKKIIDKIASSIKK
jgi:hypothetical protein